MLLGKGAESEGRRVGAETQCVKSGVAARWQGAGVARAAVGSVPRAAILAVKGLPEVPMGVAAGLPCCLEQL